MSGFFSKSHELVPEPEVPQEDYSYCIGSINNVSFSGVMTFEKCPYSLYLNKVSKILGVSGPAASRGSKIHDALEKYVQGEEDMDWGMMKSGTYYQKLIDGFKADYITGLCETEFKYALTNKLKLTKWDSRTMWHRGAIDLTLFSDSKKTQAALFDYKSGQMGKSVVHKSQLMLYALVMFMVHPKLEQIQTAAIYVDHKIDPFFTNFTREDLARFWPRWEHRLRQVTDATVFPARPSGWSCKWCQHNKTQLELNQVEPACKFGV